MARPTARFVYDEPPETLYKKWPSFASEERNLEKLDLAKKKLANKMRFWEFAQMKFEDCLFLYMIPYNIISLVVLEPRMY